MIYLAFSILSSTGIFILFKWCDKLNVNTLQVIVINYLVACICGLLFYENSIVFFEIISTTWFKASVFLAFLFISIFNVMALTAQKNGLSVASVASKMSVIIPIIFGVVVLKDGIGFQKIIGIILALVAVYLTSVKSKENTTLTRSIYLPIILFFGSGIIDTSVNYFAPDGKIELFSACIFGLAFILGFIVLLYQKLKHHVRFQTKSIPLGILLGVINYASIYYLIKALRIDGLESSSLFTINNVAIVGLSALVGWFLFKEHISAKNGIGILLALVAILLVSATNG